MDTLDWTKCLQEGFKGIRRYLMKDDDSTIKAANRKLLGYIHKIPTKNVYS